MLGKIKNFVKNCIKEVMVEQQNAQDTKETPKKQQRDFGADISSITIQKKNINELLKLSFQKSAKDFTVSYNGKQVAMDSVECQTAAPYTDMMTGTAKDILYTFFAKFGFIGWQQCALLAQHWLISNACSIPAKDAIRNGWINTFADADKEEATGEEKEKEQKFLNELNEITNTKYKLSEKLIQWITKYNIYGIGIALPKIDGIDYKKPYNPDGIKKGAFKGIAIIDPYWLTPQFDQDVMTDPTHPDFYKPTHYLTASGKKIHASHFIIIRRKEVPDILKPSYYYGGIPLTQEIYERVYAAEKSANEQPLLLLTKRVNGWKVDLNEFFMNPEKYEQRIRNFTDKRDNQGVLLIDHEDDMFQIDTTLSDLDQVVMSQYKLVAAVARIPVDKLFELNPSGALSNSGDFNIKNYTQDLNTIQNDLDKPFIDRINEIVMRSYYGRKDRIAIVFNPTDNPTAQEQATNVKTEVDTLQALIGNNVITTEEARQKLIADKRNGFSFLDEEAPEQEQDNVEIEQMMKEQQNKQQQSKAEDEEQLEFWFTTKNGVHIPVYKGQTPKEAIEKAFENKHKTKLTKVNIRDFVFNYSDRNNKNIKKELETFLPPSSVQVAQSIINQWLSAIYMAPIDVVGEIKEIEFPEKFESIDDIETLFKIVDEPLKKIKQDRYESWKKNEEHWIQSLKNRIEIYNKAKEEAENPPKGENIDSEGNKIKNPEQFKKWFGNSKAVDKNGNPIVLYHGSKHNELENNQFNFKHKGETANKQRAFFSTTRKDVAETYTDNGTGKIYKLFVKMEKPLIIDFKGEDFRTAGYEKIQVIPYGEDPDTYPTIIERKSRFADAAEAPVISKIVNYAKKNGYDGVIAKNIDDYGGFSAKDRVPEYNDDYIVFNPKEQIKSVDNDGQWSGKTIYDEAIFAEDTEWITVHPHGNKEAKGQPVPVEEGQGKGEAIKQHFARAAAGETHMYNDNDDDDDFDFSFNPEIIEEQEELEKKDKELQKEHKKEAAKAKREQKKWEKKSEEEKEAERNEWYEAEQKRQKQAKKEMPQKTLPEAKRELEEIGISGIRKPTKEGYGKERWEEYNALSPRIKRQFFDSSDSDYSLKWDEAEAILQKHKGDTADIFEYLREIDIKTPQSRTNERTRNYLKGTSEDNASFEKLHPRKADGTFAKKGTNEIKTDKTNINKTKGLQIKETQNKAIYEMAKGLYEKTDGWKNTIEIENDLSDNGFDITETTPDFIDVEKEGLTYRMHYKKENGQIIIDNVENIWEKNKESEISRNIEKVIEAAKKAEELKTNISTVSEELIKDGKENGYDFSYYVHNIDSSSVNHIFNRHGDAKKEAAEGQIAVTAEDIKKLPRQIVNDYDFIAFGGKNDRGQDVICYGKNMDDGSFVYVEEIRTGRKTLTTQTLFKRKTSINTSNSFTNIIKHRDVRELINAGNIIVIDKTKNVK